MYRVFPALEARFNRNRRLVGLARRLYHGLAGQQRGTRDSVEVTGSIVGNEDTFGTDEPIYELIFTVFGSGTLPDRTAAILEELERTYKDGVLDSAYFDVSAMLLTNASGPELGEGKVWQGRMVYELYVCRKVGVPVERRV